MHWKWQRGLVGLALGNIGSNWQDKSCTSLGVKGLKQMRYQTQHGVSDTLGITGLGMTKYNALHRLL